MSACHYAFSKPTSCTLPCMATSLVNYGLDKYNSWTFPNCHKCTPLEGDTDNGTICLFESRRSRGQAQYLPLKFAMKLIFLEKMKIAGARALAWVLLPPRNLLGFTRPLFIHGPILLESLWCARTKEMQQEQKFLVFLFGLGGGVRGHTHQCLESQGVLENWTMGIACALVLGVIASICPVPALSCFCPNGCIDSTLREQKERSSRRLVLLHCEGVAWSALTLRPSPSSIDSIVSSMSLTNWRPRT